MIRSTLIACLLAGVTALASERPNVIVIMADDLGYRDLGFQGSEVVKTPHLDALAKNGVIFTDGHAAASVCSPSRAGFITGRYQQRFGHEANCPRGKQGMVTSEYTMGQAFQSIGYKTYMIGKWHLGNLEEMYPTQRGFDSFWGLREGSRGFFYKEGKEKFGNYHSIEENGKHVAFEGFLTDRMTDAGIAMIEANKQDPFFMFLSYTAPHTPLQATPEDKAKANGNAYHALIQNMDDNIGRLVAYLEENKMRENTVIWFLSDNGGTVGSASNYPLNGKKGVEFEGGHRVPFIVNWPAKIKGGQRFDGLTSAMDIFPTSFKLAGGKETPNKLDGVDLLPYLVGEKSGDPHATLYWRKLEQAAIRHGDWKMIRGEGLPEMLYKMGDDTSELNDVAKQHPEKVQELGKMITDWEKELVEPLWQEGKGFIKVRYKKNIEYRDAEMVKPTLGAKK
ncbi:sulfatase-like hydrolase/transferase [Rubritalea tangerina]|uniref:Sulfatase-like hydrolase/transferase n=2 Tax=Rubritalea tangerina TaxID=430798 RepID=A0ABW4ZA67_9BACT